MNTLLLEVTNRYTVKVVASFEHLNDAVDAQVGAENIRIANGVPVTQQYFAVRDENDERSPLIALLNGTATADDFRPVREPATEPVQEPAKPKRVRTRTVEGVKMISKGEGHWISEDGMFEIVYDDTFETECDEPHPVKISRAMRAEYHAAPAHRQQRFYTPEFREAMVDGRKGYYCYGGEIHYYGLWVVAANDDRDVIARNDSFKGAVESLAEHIRTGKTWA